MRRGLWIVLWLLTPLAWALAPCTPESEVGSGCRLAIADLHPTQGGIGLLQVEREQAALAEKSPKQLDKLMKKKEIPVVISPDGRFWLVDRHHLTTALWRSGVREARVRVIARLKDPANFWRQMRANHWVWLQDERGRPLEPDQLPARVQDLPDYPYRTLAGLLEDAGYIDKDQQVYFIEFAWATWLGEQMGWAGVDSHNLKVRLHEAKQLACSSRAAHLPGYPGQQCLLNPARSGH
ncbi:ParB-like protein [Aeromonas diversa]|uniref:Chromosome partitioning protein ParB n=1 Tax=Aeromonas diversa CDC 2478-85 TaxID=1268237 RepID=N9VQA8_9GAMM|nr:ParB-like protein [Aeromonas diversa]ENY73703.1 hypothetical protein G114_01574 [Aeromonas diversa CDC 2478-85]